MIPRCLLLIFTSLLLMAGQCNKFDCSQLDKCDFHIKQLLTSPDGTYNAVCGQRVCNGKIVLQEVSISRKGISLNNQCGNVYISTDTVSLLTIAWTNSRHLQVSHKTFSASTTLKKEKKVLGKIGVGYSDKNLI